MLRSFAGTDPLVSSICCIYTRRGNTLCFPCRDNWPRVSDPLCNAVISGRGSFEDMSLALPDLGLDVRELEGDFDLDNGSIAATGISARLGKSRIQEAAIHLDRARGFTPSLYQRGIRP